MENKVFPRIRLNFPQARDKIPDMKIFFTLKENLPAGAGFDLWGREHLSWLIIGAALGVALCAAYRRFDRKKRDRLRVIVGCAILLCEFLKNGNLIAQGAFSVYFLPLHLCSLAVFFTFYHCLRPGKTAGNFLYSTCMPGAAFALLFPDWTAYPVFSYHSIVGFLVHFLLVTYPLMLVASGDLRPDPRRLPRCFGILAALSAVVYVFDRAVSANYMFLLEPAPGSPLEWFASILGSPGYLLGYLPMIAMVWLLLYLPFIRPASQNSRPRARTK